MFTCRLNRQQHWRRFSSISCQPELKTSGKHQDQDLLTILAALKSCGRSRDLEAGKKHHAAAVKKGYGSNPYVSTSAVDMYSRCGSMPDAHKVFDTILHPDVVAWNNLLLGYVRNGESERCLQLFYTMQARGVEPNTRSFLPAFMACSNLASREQGKEEEAQGKLVKVKTLERGSQLHKQLIKCGFDSDSYLATTVVDFYAKCGKLDEAEKVFNRILNRNVVCWTVFMLACLENGEPELALDYFSKMPCAPDAHAFVAALAACSSLSEKDSSTMAGRGFVKLNTLRRTMKLHSRALKHGCESSVFVASSLVDIYAKCGSMVDSRRVFDRMITHDVVLWTALIRGYAENEEATLALELFFCMQAAGFSSDAQSFVAALLACNSVVALETGERILADVFRLGLETDVVVANCSLDFYGKCGSPASAQLVFDSFAAPNTKCVVPWNSLMAAYGQRGETSEMFHLFDRMIEEGVRASSITFLNVLTACSHAGLVSRGEHYFHSMNRYGVSPQNQHYTCMVDLLGRANHLDRALEFLQRIPGKPDPVNWTTLLSSCRKWKNVRIGKLAFETLLTLDRQQGAHYALMASIYGAAGMWEERAQVLRGRRVSNAWKEAGQSWWSDGDGVIHRFLAGDRSHPQMELIDVKLRELLREMKSRGYVPDVENVFDTADAAKEDSLCEHSERLAIACALINSPERSRIRISKNLRVCEDCHRATALISRIENPEIICRDASRFHVFLDGKCSCKGFW